MSPCAIHILAVDDEPNIGALTKSFLESSESMEVNAVCSVAEARIALGQRHYDVIISDYQMPIEDGIQFLKSLRQSGDHIPFILFTGKGREEVVIEALNNGADSYLQKGGKPVPQYAELEHRVRTAVQKRQAEEALRDSESGLQRAEKVAGLGHWQLDLSTQVISGSEEAISICGLDRGSMEYSEFRKVIVSDYVPLLNRSIKELIEQGKPYNVEAKICRKSDGRIVDVQSIAEYDRMKKVVFGTLQDITRRKRAEEALQESEDKYRLLVQNANMAIVVLQGGMTKLVNATAIEKMGFPESVLRSRPFLSFVHPEDRALVLDRYQMRLQGIPTPDHYEARILTQKGETLWVEVHAVAIVWEGLPAALNFLNDITERKRAEEEMRHQDEMRQKILDSIPVMVGLFDREGRYEFVNRCWQSTLGWSLEEMLQHEDIFAEFYPDPEYRRYVHEYIASAAGSGCWSDFKTRIRNGQVRNTSWINVPLSDGSIIGIGVDITERKRSEEALQEANRKLNLMSSITRHDIANQLLLLTGNLMQMGGGTDRSMSEAYLQRANAAAQRISDMIQFTKEYENIGMQAPAWVSPGRQIADAFTMLHPIGVEWKDDTHGMEVLADPLVEKVSYNLINNSMLHGERVTRIRMSEEQRGDALLMVYEDDGVGISDEDKKRLFEKGFGKNTGFGLFLIREILAITGITIVETGKAGEGARFEMLVPPGAWRRPPPVRLEFRHARPPP